jgi:TctA family transporter
LAVGIAVLGALLEASVRHDLAGGHGDRAAAFSSALDELLLIAAVVNLVGALAAALLVRQSDLWTPPREAPAATGAPQPAGAYFQRAET